MSEYKNINYQQKHDVTLDTFRERLKMVPSRYTG